MERILIIGLCLLCCSCATWRPSTRYEEVAYQFVNIADGVSTTDRLRYGCSERNPLLGQHPSQKDVAVFIVSAGLIHLAVTNYLENNYPELVPYSQGFSIGVKTGVVVHNMGLNCN